MLEFEEFMTPDPEARQRESLLTTLFRGKTFNPRMEFGRSDVVLSPDQKRQLAKKAAKPSVGAEKVLRRQELTEEMTMGIFLSTVMAWRSTS